MPSWIRRNFCLHSPNIVFLTNYTTSLKILCIVRKLFAVVIGQPVVSTFGTTEVCIIQRAADGVPSVVTLSFLSVICVLTGQNWRKGKLVLLKSKGLRSEGPHGSSLKNKKTSTTSVVSYLDFVTNMCTWGTP